MTFGSEYTAPLAEVKPYQYSWIFPVVADKEAGIKPWNRELINNLCDQILIEEQNVERMFKEKNSKAIDVLQQRLAKMEGHLTLLLELGDEFKWGIHHFPKNMMDKFPKHYTENTGKPAISSKEWFEKISKISSLPNNFIQFASNKTKVVTSSLGN